MLNNAKSVHALLQAASNSEAANKRKSQDFLIPNVHEPIQETNLEKSKRHSMLDVMPSIHYEENKELMEFEKQKSSELEHELASIIKQIQANDKSQQERERKQR